MEKIRKFIECLIPVTSCNLKCDYCYVIQEERRKMDIPKLEYPIDVIKKATSKERWGGSCYFSICGAGETLIPDYTIDLVEVLLNNGHYVNITTNGTLSVRFDEFIFRFSREMLEHMHISFSFHYLELKRLNLIDRFFDNVKKMRNAGCCCLIQMNMCDQYIPYIDEIKKLFEDSTEPYPEIAVTRKETGNFPNINISLYTKDEDKYLNACKEFNSPLFEFTNKNFMVKRKEFCYAGSWGYQLNLKTGLLKRCYNSCVVQNIFKDVNKPIFDLPVGCFCNERYCINSSHFMSLGIIPDIKTPSYYELRHNGQEHKLKEVLEGKLEDTNQRCGKTKKMKVFIAGLYDKLAYKCYSFMLVQREKFK